MRNLKEAAVGLGITIVLLVVVELGARVLKTFHDDVIVSRIRDWLVYSDELGWELRPEFAGLALREYREFDDAGVSFHHRPTSASSPRILLIGDSVTYGYGVSVDSTFAAMLARRLPDAEIINRAVPGYSSYQGAKLLERLLDAPPDLVIASFSYNDRRYVISEDHRDGPEQFRTMSRWSRFGFLSDYYTFRYLRHFMAKLRPASTTVDLRQVSVRVPVGDYADNLRSMVERCRERDVPIVLIAMRDNPGMARNVYEARALGRHSPGLAVRIYDEAISMNCFAPLARREKAILLDEMGRYQSAAVVAVVRASVELPGGAPLRFDSDYSDVMVQVAHGNDAHLLDLRAALQKRPGLFFDDVHLTPEGHAVVSGGLEPVIRKFVTGLRANGR